MANERYDLAHKAAVDDLLLGMPGVKGGKAFGYPAYKVNGKVFAFVGSRGLAIKLPEKRVKALLEDDDRPAEFAPFEVAEKIVWKSWLSIQPEDVAQYADFEPLFAESVQFVAENA